MIAPCLPAKGEAMSDDGSDYDDDWGDYVDGESKMRRRKKDDGFSFWKPPKPKRQPKQEKPDVIGCPDCGHAWVRPQGEPTTNPLADKDLRQSLGKEIVKDEVAPFMTIRCHFVTYQCHLACF